MAELPPKQQYNIAQVAATMEIEEMPLDGQTYENLAQLATGKKNGGPDKKGVQRWIKYTAIRIHLF